MKSPFSPHVCLGLTVAMIGCRGAKDGVRETARAAQDQAAVTPATESAIHSEGECPGNGAIALHAITFARADSLGRALLSRAGIDARGDCAVIIAETDSSVLVGYARPALSKESLASGRVLHYGGGIVVEVLPSGRAKWLYATQ